MRKSTVLALVALAAMASSCAPPVIWVDESRKGLRPVGEPSTGRSSSPTWPAYGMATWPIASFVGPNEAMSSVGLAGFALGLGAFVVPSIGTAIPNLYREPPGEPVRPEYLSPRPPEEVTRDDLRAPADTQE